MTRRVALAGLLALALTTHARADFINFTYTGRGFGTATGSGSFSFADGLTKVTLADLTAFSFSQSTNFGDLIVPTFTYGLGNLISFTATIGPGSALTDLSLLTGTALPNPLKDSHGTRFASEFFQVFSLATNGAKTSSTTENFTAGTVTQAAAAAVPAPPTLLLGLVGAGVTGVARLRRRGRPSNPG
jgi:hypothetical protein